MASLRRIGIDQCDVKPWMYATLRSQNEPAEIVSMPTPDGTIMVRTKVGDPTTMKEVWLDEVAAFDPKDRRQIGRKYGDNNQYGQVTYLDPRLNGKFKLRTFPGLVFRIRPDCDGLICHDGEVVVQSHNGPNGEWLDFIREQQAEVLRYLDRP
jgi:hypothetical protein